MSDARKIEFLNSRKVAPRALLASVAEDDEVEAIVMVVRRNGCWETCWSSGTSYGGLCMAVIKLQHDATLQIHEESIEAEDDPSEAG